MTSSADGDADKSCLAARFVDGPHLSAPDKAAQRLADWLTDLATEQATARLVASLAAAKHTTPETILLWWLRRHPARISPVIGSARPERIRACRDAVLNDPRLTHEEWYDLWITARGASLP